jgi:hypothetical protein
MGARGGGWGRGWGQGALLQLPPAPALLLAPAPLLSEQNLQAREPTGAGTVSRGGGDGGSAAASSGSCSSSSHLLSCCQSHSTAWRAGEAADGCGRAGEACRGGGRGGWSQTSFAAAPALVLPLPSCASQLAPCCQNHSTAQHTGQARQVTGAAEWGSSGAKGNERKGGELRQRSSSQPKSLHQRFSLTAA